MAKEGYLSKGREAVQVEANQLVADLLAARPLAASLLAASLLVANRLAQVLLAVEDPSIERELQQFHPEKLLLRRGH